MPTKKVKGNRTMAKKPDPSVIKKKILSKSFLHPFVTIPFSLGLFGTTTNLGLYYLAWKLSSIVPELAAQIGTHPLWTFASVALLFVSGGIGLTRFLNMSEEDEEEIVEELRNEYHVSEQEQLRGLYKRLKSDGDKRTHRLLNRLIAFDRALRDKGLLEGLEPVVSTRLRAGIERSFHHCIGLFEESLELLDTSKGLPSRSARKILLQKREEKIDSVDQTVQSLEKVLEQVEE